VKFEKDDELIQAMHEAVDAEAQKAANILRDKYVIPFCDRYGFRFVVGNGVHIFVCTETEEIHEAVLPGDIDRYYEEGDGEARAMAHEINNALIVLQSVLNDGPLGNHFGWDSWMEDYKP